MYFSIQPNILYDQKPIKYPFSQAEATVAKNFFRRYKISEDVEKYAVLFKPYTIKDGERPDMVAQKLYDNPFYDWVILLTNNLVNAQYDWPMTNYTLYKVLEKEYNDPYNEIHHYETIKIGQYPKGLRVDKAFYDKQHTINDNGTVTIKNGNEICSPITVSDHYSKENEKRRKINVLRGNYFQSFLADFKKNSQYKKSNSFVAKRLKSTG
tara:strand:+ start:1844 stop:2473 length:630 start_codon:yes stop_codon:yes gene_type:complete